MGYGSRGGRMAMWLVAVSVGSPLTTMAYGANKPVKVTITDENSGCAHDVDKKKEKFKKNQDSIGWRVSNRCDDAQKVLICVYASNPFKTCTSHPAGLDIGTAFTVGSNKKATLDCVAEDEGEYLKLVLVGKEVPSYGCPTTPDAKVDVEGDVILTHKLDIVIE